ncbi:MAG TPA: hypothetical protein VFW66_09300 [Gemmatimonadales bacterium]|nr:hypothetical protein [Gemmatimonadales bacterium]
MDAAFDHALAEFTAAPGARLDAAALSALVVAAAGAVGMPSHGPPVARPGTGTLGVALVCREGHIVIHVGLDDGLCLVDVVARRPAEASRGMDVIRRRLGG